MFNGLSSVPMERRLFIGDVHGQYDALLRLWDLISPGSGDSVYYVGDLIDRGPKTPKPQNPKTPKR